MYIQPKAVQPVAAAAATATGTGNNSKQQQVADKMKALANQLSHGELKLEGAASGIKTDR